MKTILLALGLAAVCASSAFGQPASTATLRVTVVDPSGAVIVGATVTVTGAEAATRAPSRRRPAKTADTGIATVDRPRAGPLHDPGGVSRASRPAQLPDVRVRSGENRQVAVLPIPKLEASVTVDAGQTAGRGGSARALVRHDADARRNRSAVGRSRTLQQQLQDMAGPGAVIRIDGFEGGALPAKAQIRSIRISRDQFAAEYHSAGGVSIEIITQPGHRTDPLLHQPPRAGRCA